MTPLQRSWRTLAAGFGLLFAVGCSAIPVEGPIRYHANEFSLLEYFDELDSPAEDLDLYVERRELVHTESGSRLLEIRFSFVAVRGFLGPEDVHRTTGSLFLPVDDRGAPTPRRGGDVLMTEYPPGFARTGFAFLREYGHRPPLELGIPSALVDIQGPLARDLRNFQNPAAAPGRTFTSLSQLAHSQLRGFQQSADFRDLVEWHLALAWARALTAVRTILANEADFDFLRVTLAAEGWSAVGAAQAAAIDAEVIGFVVCGWPHDFLDHQFVRWRRWEREARFDPLSAERPIPWRDSQELISFLTSSWGKPDPGCPSCKGGGDVWRNQFELASLLGPGAPLEDVYVLRLVGDSDLELPLDLEARAAAPAELLTPDVTRIPASAAGPSELRGVGAATFGPWSVPRPFPWDDLRYLHESESTLANAEAAESVLAWMQRQSYRREPPMLLASEGTKDGDIVVDVGVVETDAAILEVWLEVASIPDHADTDFRYEVRRDPDSSVGWRRVDAFFAGPGPQGVNVWRARFARENGRDQIYYPVVRTRSGDVWSSHSLPARPFWHLGDPASGRVRLVRPNVQP